MSVPVVARLRTEWRRWIVESYISDTVRTGQGAGNWTQTFTDSAFTSLTKVSDTFTNGGVTGTLMGDTITVTWAGTDSDDGLLAATFNVGSVASAPEPSSAVIVAMTAIAVALGYCWRNRSISRSLSRACG